VTRAKVEQVVGEARRRLLAWAEEHQRALSDLRELEAFGISPEKCVALILYGEEALRQAVGDGDVEPQVPSPREIINPPSRLSSSTRNGTSPARAIL
jgi:hypothetical protein